MAVSQEQKAPQKFSLAVWAASVRGYAERGRAAVDLALSCKPGEERERALDEMRMAQGLLNQRIGFDHVLQHLDCHDALVKALENASAQLRKRICTNIDRRVLQEADAALITAGAK